MLPVVLIWVVAMVCVAAGGRRARRALGVVTSLVLDVARLLHVLPPGPELDRERQRVESLLDWSGLRFDDVG